MAERKGKGRRPKWSKADELAVTPSVVRRWDLPEQGLVRRGRKVRGGGVRVRVQGVDLGVPHDKTALVVFNEATGQVEVRSGQLDLLGANDRGMHQATTFRRAANLELTTGGGDVKRMVHEVFQQSGDRVHWWTSRKDLGRNVLPCRRTRRAKDKG